MPALREVERQYGLKFVPEKLPKGSMLLQASFDVVLQPTVKSRSLAFNLVVNKSRMVQLVYQHIEHIAAEAAADESEARAAAEAEEETLLKVCIAAPQHVQQRLGRRYAIAGAELLICAGWITKFCCGACGLCGKHSRGKHHICPLLARTAEVHLRIRHDTLRALRISLALLDVLLRIGMHTLQ